MRVCGFRVVRKPEYNFEPSVEWLRRPPMFQGRYYGGVERIDDVATAYHTKQLPEDARQLYESAVAKSEGLFRPMYRELETAKIMLDLVNSKEGRSEIIAVKGSKLALCISAVDVADGIFTVRGFDPFQLGGGSLLLEGLFAVPEQFSRWGEKLTCGGLLQSRDDALEYIKEHVGQVRVNLLEELFPEDLCPIEPLEVLTLG